MADMKVVFKKSCSYSQPSGIVSVKQLMIVEENGKNYLAMRLVNERSETVSSVTVKITEYDEYGKVICVTPIDFEVNGGANAVFVPDQKIELEDGTRDCDVVVMSAVYGAYIYRSVKNKTVVDYNASGPAPTAVAPKRRYADKAGESGIEVKPRKLKIPLLVIFALIASLVAAVFAMYIHMTVFVSTENTFYYNGVEYAFADGDRSDGSDIYVIGFHGFRSRIVIPEKIDGHAVKGIRDGAFADNHSLTGIAFESMLPVGDKAFANCIALKSVDFDHIEVFGDGAFSGCTSLDNVVIKSHLVGVPDGAFSGCTSLSAVTFEETGTRIALGKKAFSDCPALRVVDFKRQVDYAASGECDFFAGSAIDDLRLLNFELPARLASKGLAQLFGAKKAEDVRLGKVYIDYLASVPSGLAKGISSLVKFETKYLENAAVGADAFNGCTGLTVFNCPKAITEVGARAFSGSAVSEFDFSAVEVLGSRAFAGCSKLEKVSFLGNTVLDGLGAEMFADCTSLKEATLPVGITVIESGLFKNCSSLSDVRVYGDCVVVSIGNDAFSGCASLSGIPALGGGLEQIGGRAFKDCVGFVELVVPDTVSAIGVGAFEGCNKVRSYTAPFIGIAEGSPTGYLASVFGGKNWSSSSAVPETLTSVTVTLSSVLPDSAFYGLKNLEKVNLPLTLSQIGANAFCGCAAIKEISLPTSLRYIGAYAFDGCSGLYSVTLPAGLFEIGEYAFSRCTAFRALDIPITVSSIGENAFAGCSALEKVKMPLPVAFAGLFAGSVPETLKTVEVVGTSVLPAYAFAQCGGIENVTLPDGLTQVGSYAFLGCSSIKSLTVPSSVVTMGVGIIAGMPSLAELSVPFVGGRATTVGDYSSGDTSFTYMIRDESGGYLDANVYALKKITLTATEFIPYNAFTGGKYIQRIALDCDVKQIDPSAFDNCFALYEVFNGSDLDIVRGGTDHGGIARNVLAVHDGADAEPLPYTVYDGYGFVTSPENVRYMVDYDRAAYDYTDENDMPDVVRRTDLPAFGLYRIWQHLFSEARFKSIYIPSNVVGIGISAFNGASALGSVLFASDSTLDAIEASTFVGCGALYEIQLPDSVTRIEDFAFAGCRRLKRFDVGAQIARIGDYAFNGCDRLFEVYNRSELDIKKGYADHGMVALNAVEVYGRDEISDNPNIALPQIVIDGVQYMRFDGVWYIVDFFGNDGVLKIMPFEYNGEKVNDIRIYNSQSFECEGYGVTELLLGNVMQQVRSSDFSYLYGVNKLKITSCGGAYDKMTLSDGAFSAMGNLETVECDVPLASVGSGAIMSGVLRSVTLGDVDAIETGVLGYDGYDTVIKLGNVGTIANSAFSGRLISELYIESVNTVGDYAFRNSGLRKVKIGSVNSIGRYSFADCGMLSSVDLGSNAAALSIGESAFVNAAFDKFEYGGDVSIGRNAFFNSVGLTEVSLGNVSVIGENAFGSSYALESFAATSVDTIGDSAFSQTFALRSFVVGGNISSIGSSVFSNSALQKIEFKGDVGTIGRYAFQSYNLSEIVFRGKLDSIEPYAFYGSGITKIALPDNLTNIPAWAFGNCISLREVTLPASLNVIADSAFTGSMQILLVYNRSNVEIRSGVFYDVIATVNKESDAVVEYYNTNGKLFAKIVGEWYLIVGSDYNNGIFMTPRNVRLSDGTPLEKFGVAKTVFAGMPDVYIGREVTRVTPYAVMSGSRVYYEGTAAKWREIYDGDVSLDMLYYADCIHDNASGVWRFDDDGITPTTANTVIGIDAWKVVVAATCVEYGKEEAACEHCGKKFTRVVGMIDHTVSDGECTRCGMAAERVSAATADSLTAAELNYEKGGFELTDDGLSAHSRSAQCGVTAKHDGEVVFTVRNRTASGVAAVKLNGETKYELVGGGTFPVRVSVAAGDTVSVVFDAGAGSGSIELYITDFIVLYEASEGVEE